MMEAAPTVYKVAAGVMALYGLVAIVGGLIGYLRAGSVASVAAGVPSGVLLIACAAMTFQRPQWSLIGAIVVALAVGGFFASNLLKHLGDLGDFIQSSAGPRTIGMFVGALLVIVTAVIALVTKPPQ
jgi:uncharacterized membrane protein (UPF0136 family)